MAAGDRAIKNRFGVWVAFVAVRGKMDMTG